MKKHIDEVEIKSYLGKNTILASKQTGNVVVECFGETITDAENTAEIVAHCLNTHQMLLDALKDAEAFLRLRNLGANADKLNCSVIRPAIEAAENVEVSE